jgi:hypothetical protein
VIEYPFDGTDRTHRCLPAQSGFLTRSRIFRICVEENQGLYKIASSGDMFRDKLQSLPEAGLGMEIFGLWRDCRTGDSGGSTIDGSRARINTIN